MGKMAMRGGSAPLTKGALAASVATTTGLKPKQVKAVFEALANVTSQSLKKSGKVKLPGIAMIKTRQKPATKAGMRNIFGKEVRVAAMKARTVVKAFPAKVLKDEYK